MMLQDSIGICPVRFYKRYEVWPPADIIADIVEEYRTMYRKWLIKWLTGEVPINSQWCGDHYLMTERMLLKLRVRMIDAGYFPGTADWDDDEEGHPARSRMFNTHHHWTPINSQAATYMPEPAA